MSNMNLYEFCKKYSLDETVNNTIRMFEGEIEIEYHEMCELRKNIYNDLKNASEGDNVEYIIIRNIQQYI